MFKNSASKAFEYVNTAKQVASSLGFFSKSSSAAATKAPVAAITAPPIANTSATTWTKWAVPAAYGVGGLLVSGAAAGAAYYKRDDLGMGYKWATDHMKYVGTLWDEKSLKKRLEQLVEIENNLGVTFREYDDYLHLSSAYADVTFFSYYTLLPPKPPQYQEPRTFAILPPQNSPLRKYFLSVENNLAEDEISAHTGMFEASKNDSYYGLGIEVAKVVREAVMTSRGIVTNEYAPHNVEATEPAVQEASQGENLLDN